MSDFNIVLNKSWKKNLFVFIINIVVKAWRVFAKKSIKCVVGFLKKKKKKIKRLIQIIQTIRITLK